MVIFQLHSLPLRSHDLASPRQHPRPPLLGAKSTSRMAHTLFLTPQRPLHRTLYSPRRNRDEQSNDSSTKLLLQKHYVDPFSRTLHLRYFIRGHVCLFIALLDKFGGGMVGHDPFQ